MRDGELYLEQCEATDASFTFSVDDVVLAGYVYDSGQNVETSDMIVVP